MSSNTLNSDDWDEDVSFNDIENEVYLQTWPDGQLKVFLTTLPFGTTYILNDRTEPEIIEPTFSRNDCDWKNITTVVDVFNSLNPSFAAEQAENERLTNEYITALQNLVIRVPEEIESNHTTHNHYSNVPRLDESKFKKNKKKFTPSLVNEFGSKITPNKQLPTSSAKTRRKISSQMKSCKEVDDTETKHNLRVAEVLAKHAALEQEKRIDIILEMEQKKASEIETDSAKASRIQIAVFNIAFNRLKDDDFNNYDCVQKQSDSKSEIKIKSKEKVKEKLLNKKANLDFFFGPQTPLSVKKIERVLPMDFVTSGNKTQLCKYLTQYGVCRKPDCTYAHSMDDLKYMLCHKDFNCPNLELCRYIHTEDTSIPSYMNRLKIVDFPLTASAISNHPTAPSSNRSQTASINQSQPKSTNRSQPNSNNRSQTASNNRSQPISNNRSQPNSNDRSQTASNNRSKTASNNRSQTASNNQSQTASNNRSQPNSNNRSQPNSNNRSKTASNTSETQNHLKSDEAWTTIGNSKNRQK